MRAATARLVADGEPVTIAAVARAARVSRTLCYSDPELRAEIDRHRTGESGPSSSGRRISEASLKADLAHARAQLHALDQDNRLLRDRLARSLGDEIDRRWLQPQPALLDQLEQRALELATDNTALRADAERLTAANTELTESLDAARAMNRELIARLNR